MATVKSNRNSVLNTCSQTGLNTLKNRLTTCLKYLRAKLQHQQEEHHHHNRQRQQHIFSNEKQQQQHSEGVFNKEHSRVDRHFQEKNFSKKFKRFFLYTPTKKFKRWCNKSSVSTSAATTTTTVQRQRKGKRIEIVAKLLSSTLIATTTTTTSTVTENTLTNNMTITENTFMAARDENPELDAEVRSILMARAQDGATISEIKEDYRKMTGMYFPLLDNITDFLLTIPTVTAYCTELGTRIFNIIPTDKTRHLFDLITKQKPQQQPYVPRRPYAPKRYYPAWRANDYTKNTHNKYFNEIHNNNKKWTDSVMPRPTSKPIQVVASPPPIQCKTEMPAPVVPMEIDKNSWLEDSLRTDAPKDVYQDNLQYLCSRLHSNTQHIVMPVANEGTQVATQLPPPEAATKSHQQNVMAYNRAVKRKQVSYAKPWLRTSIGTRSTSPTITRSSQCTDSCYCTMDEEFDAHLYDFPLLGDDFFLYFARMELGCKFKKNQRVMQSGLCVSGQTIGAALNRLRRLDDCSKRVIVNIGSVDIMQGRSLLQVEHDYRQLINAMVKKGLTPILTTLAPLANYSHDKELKQKVERFNEFIKREGEYLVVIDIWSCLVNESRQTLFDCYQNGPRSVSGAAESYVFWNKIGRQRVLKLLEASIEY